MAFVAFPESHDAILSNEKRELLVIEASGSLGIEKNGKCIKTNTSATLISSKENEWCSNIARDAKDPSQNPFIQYSIRGKQMKVTHYSVRNGCCTYFCCCNDENGKIIDETCCCFLYSYSLQASNDNITWTIVHKVEKDKSFDYCQTKTFELSQSTQPFRYFRFVLDEEWPGCPKCMQINQIELYGKTINYEFDEFESSEEESVSIIGKVRKNEQ